MHQIDVTTDDQRKARLLDFAAQDHDQAGRDQAAKRSNAGFTQVTEKGWNRLDDLVSKNPAAARVYLFFCKHVGGAENAVVISQQLIAQETKLSLSSVKRHLAALEELNAILRIQIQGGACAYCLDPYEIWRYWGGAQDLAAFRTKTLVSKKANQVAERQMKLLFGPVHEEEQA